MNVERAKDFTIHRIIFPDMVLNWFLGIVLLLVPKWIDDVVGTGPVLPIPAYYVMAVLFLVFAAWQVWIIRRNDIREPGLIYAALMAEGPVVVLTMALLLWNLPLYPVVRVLLWIGNIYMLFLGAWYFTLAYLINRRRATAA
jgi:hypothetical protein